MKVAIVGLLLAFSIAAVVVAVNADTSATENFTNGVGSCAPSIRPPVYYCYAMPISDSDGDPDGTISFYVKEAPDGSFTGGHIWGTDFDGDPSFNATNWTGQNLSGSFSGTMPDGTVFSGQVTEHLGAFRHWAGGGRVGRVLVTSTRVTDGFGTITSTNTDVQ